MRPTSERLPASAARSDRWSHDATPGSPRCRRVFLGTSRSRARARVPDGALLPGPRHLPGAAPHAGVGSPGSPGSGAKRRPPVHHPRREPRPGSRQIVVGRRRLTGGRPPRHPSSSPPVPGIARASGARPSSRRPNPRGGADRAVRASPGPRRPAGSRRRSFNGPGAARRAALSARKRRFHGCPALAKGLGESVPDVDEDADLKGGEALDIVHETAADIFPGMRQPADR
jgi:hypothetical protein